MLAAVPTLVGGFLGAPLTYDDWSLAVGARYRSFGAAFGGEARSRPLGGLWHWAEFKSLGTHPLPHAFVLASVNAAAAVLYWKLLDRWLPRRIAVLSALVWVVLANRGSMRLWYTTSHAVFSLVLLLAAGLIASREPFTGRRFGTVLALLVAATFLYEGGLALGGVGLLLLVWMRAERERRNLLLTITVVVLGAAGTWTLLTSPKLGTSPTPLRNATHLISSHFGEGVLPGYSTILATVTLLVVAWSLASVVLPGFKARLEERCVLVGLVVLVLGAAPFMASGFPFSTEGFFDRANLFADLGTALVYGSILAMLFRLRWPAVATALSAGVLIAFAVPNASDVSNFVRAGPDGTRLLKAVDALPPDLRTKGPMTFLPLPLRGGVAEFVADYDISGALALRYHTGWPYPRARMAIAQTGFTKPEGPVFQLVGDHLVRRDDAFGQPRS